MGVCPLKQICLTLTLQGSLNGHWVLTLAVPPCVASGTVTTTGANVEMSEISAAHAAWVPGNLW